MKELDSEPGWTDIFKDVCESFVNAVGWQGYLAMSLMSVAVGVSIYFNNINIIAPPEAWLAFSMWCSGSALAVAVYEFASKGGDK